jgi:hypothetical protein
VHKQDCRFLLRKGAINVCADSQLIIIAIHSFLLSFLGQAYLRALSVL